MRFLSPAPALLVFATQPALAQRPFHKDRSASMMSPEVCERPITIDHPSRDQLAPRGTPAGRSISFRNGMGPRRPSGDHVGSRSPL